MSGLRQAKGTAVSRFATVLAGEPSVIYAANNCGLFSTDDAALVLSASSTPATATASNKFQPIHKRIWHLYP